MDRQGKPLGAFELLIPAPDVPHPDGLAGDLERSQFWRRNGLIAALLIVPLYHQVVTTTQANTKPELISIDISPYLAKLPPGKDKAGGGGGGGERMQTPPTKGRLPKWRMEQLTPPMATLRNLK